MRFTTSLFALVPFIFTSAVNAVGPTPLDVWVPKMTSPTAGAVLVSKTPETITWDTSNAPPTISNKAMLMLRHNNITAPFILAQGFDLRAGTLDITVPWVLSDGGYQFVLFGDSGNFSPFFSIQSNN
jgi:hypothetical protein